VISMNRHVERVDSLCLESKFIVVAPDKVLHPGQITVRQGRVEAVREGRGQRPDVDLGETVLLPGLINAHTHLEFSQLSEPFPPGENFAEWISQVVRYRMQVNTLPASEPLAPAVAQLARSIHLGLQESFSSGVVMLGDIVTPPWQPACIPIQADFEQQLPRSDPPRELRLEPCQLAHLWPVSCPRVMPFTEVLGVQAERFESSWCWGEETRNKFAPSRAAPYGLSPHAPYSIHFPTAARRLAEMSVETVVAMHVAESPAELAWLQGQSGPLGELYERLGITGEISPPTIEQCLQLLARPNRSLLIHGNYLTPAQLTQVAGVPGITVVFCPRTHAHFGHAPYPLSQIQQLGIKLALGTDSRASNPNLCLWDEVVQVKRSFPETPAQKLLEWVTVRPAWGLGVEREWGSLEPGRRAGLNAIPARAAWTHQNLLEQLVQLTTAELQLAPLSCWWGKPVG
jgi:aminodeoxyfutalosine deaminase